MNVIGGCSEGLGSDPGENRDLRENLRGKKES